jgi:hypothetical protein
MLKKTIVFTDFNGKEHSKDLYFHVSKAAVLTAPDAVYDEIIQIGQKLEDRGHILEGAEQEVNEKDPFSENNLLVAESVRMIARLLDRLVDLSYGEKTEDGERFIKGEEVLANFKQSAVYDAFIEHMITHQEEMLEFIKRLLEQ